MQAELQTQLTFHLTGRKPPAGLDAVEGLGLRPALFANYRNLTELRYDFPIVLVDEAPARAWVQCLSGILDGVVHECARGDDADRLTKHMLRLEQVMRGLIAQKPGGSLSALWDRAAAQLNASGDEALKASLERARAALKIDGEVLDCDISLPRRLIAHAWQSVNAQKRNRFLERLETLELKLSDIVRADDAHSAAARSPGNLASGFGTLHSDAFDFEAMSRVLGEVSAQAMLPASRRQRIVDALETLRSQRFWVSPRQQAAGVKPYAFIFENCSAALAAYRERLPKAVDLARAMEISKLEIEGEYREAVHDAFFEGMHADNLDPQLLAELPDYLVCLNADALQPGEQEHLMEILSSELPMKVLVQTDDILHESAIGDGHLGVALRSRQLTNAAVGLNDVYVLQAAASHLFQFRDRVLKAMAQAGPALLSVYSGASGTTDGLPAYLVAAAATESRAFAAFVFDPAAGPNWASRFYLDGNSQVDADWPVHSVTYEDEGHRRAEQRVAFTLVDFVACDERFSRHFARVPRASWNGGLGTVEDCLASSDPRGVPSKVPCILMTDANNVLQRVIVDGRLVREAQRCRDNWHSLQELAGIHNSHAERLLARERQARQAQGQQAVPASGADNVVEIRATAEIAAAPAAASAPASADLEEKAAADEPYIETPRCTTCNECTQINDKMFAYNDNKQAYIANPSAGTYAQLVEAAESCQVAIIHPGKPRNPDEPGLDELLKRAEPFL